MGEVYTLTSYHGYFQFMDINLQCISKPINTQNMYLYFYNINCSGSGFSGRHLNWWAVVVVSCKDWKPERPCFRFFRPTDSECSFPSSRLFSHCFTNTRSHPLQKSKIHDANSFSSSKVYRYLHIIYIVSKVVHFTNNSKYWNKKIDIYAIVRIRII